MNGKDIAALYDEVTGKLEANGYKGRALKAFQDNLQDLAEKYRGLSFEEKHQAAYETLVRVGRELIDKERIGKNDKLMHFIRLGYSCIKDVTEKPRPQKDMARAYIVSCALFLPMTLIVHWVIPILLLPPAIIGYYGLQRRELKTFIVGGSILPMCFFLSMFVLANMGTVFRDRSYSKLLEALSEAYKMAPGNIHIVVVVVGVLSVVLLGSSLLALYLLLKDRRMFV